MKIDVAKSIRSVLDKGKGVGINGIGTIKLVYLPAKFGEQRKTILPPSVDMELTEDKSDNKALIKAISEENQISKKKAKKVLEKFTKRVFNGLVNFGKVNIQGIGVIEKSGDGDIIFTADQEFTDQYFKDLPEVEAKFIDRSQIVEEEATPVIPPSNGDKTESFEATLERIADKAAQEEATDTEAAAYSSAMASDASTSEVMQVDSDQQKEFIPTEWSPTEEKKKNYLVPILIGLGILLLIFGGIKMCQYIQSDQSDIPTSVEEQKAKENEDDAALSDMNPSQDTTQMVIPDECIIITGVFASQVNIDNMVATIEANGYSAYLEPFGPYTRTGIIFACQDVVLEDYIRTVRSNISANAWYLEPRLYVEYENEN